MPPKTAPSPTRSRLESRKAPQALLRPVLDLCDRTRTGAYLENTKPDWALCYRFNIVLRGRNATPMETK